MNGVDLQRLAEDQVVAEDITLHPVGELDEAGARGPTDEREVPFQKGDTVVIFGEYGGNVAAYKNLGRSEKRYLPPYLFPKDEIRRIIVEGASRSSDQDAR